MIETKDIFNLLHNAIETQELGKKISHKNMAQRLGISARSYQDWRLGNSRPQAAVAFAKMLCELRDDEILHFVKTLRKHNDKDTN